VSARHAVDARVRLYDTLFSVPDPGASRHGAELTELLNPASLELRDGCKLEASLAAAAPEARFQFERQGYFCADRHESAPGAPVFNRTVALRDSWSKQR